MGNLAIELSTPEIAAALLNSDAIRRVQNPTPLFKAWALYLDRLADEAYKTESAPFGPKWQELKAATLARKKGRGRILVESRLMRDTTAARATEDGAILGANRPVGEYSLLAIHQFGAPRRSIVPRPVLPLDTSGDPLPQVITELAQLANDYILG